MSTCSSKMSLSWYVYEKERKCVRVRAYTCVYVYTLYTCCDTYMHTYVGSRVSDAHAASPSCRGRKYTPSTRAVDQPPLRRNDSQTKRGRARSASPIPAADASSLAFVVDSSTALACAGHFDPRQPAESGDSRPLVCRIVPAHLAPPHPRSGSHAPPPLFAEILTQGSLAPQHSTRGSAQQLSSTPPPLTRSSSVDWSTVYAASSASSHAHRGAPRLNLNCFAPLQHRRGIDANVSNSHSHGGSRLHRQRHNEPSHTATFMQQQHLAHNVPQFQRELRAGQQGQSDATLHLDHSFADPRAHTHMPHTNTPHLQTPYHQHDTHVLMRSQPPSPTHPSSHPTAHSHEYFDDENQDSNAFFQEQEGPPDYTSLDLSSHELGDPFDFF